MNFEEKLMSLRKAKGLSQEDLGNKIGVSRQTISKWESSQTTPEMTKLIELSKIFEISVDELINNVRKDEEKEDEKEKIIETKTNVSLKSTNILIIIACVLILIGFIVSLILYFNKKEQLYVEDMIMITYTVTLQNDVSVTEIYSFNDKNECIGTSFYVCTKCQADFEHFVNEISNSEKDEVDNVYGIELSSNEITWSSRKNYKETKNNIIEDKQELLGKYKNFKIIDM